MRAPFLLLLLPLLSGQAWAAGSTPTPTPARAAATATPSPSPSPTATPAPDDEMPTVAYEPKPAAEWDDSRTASEGFSLGIRAGYHGFSGLAGGGLALEAVAAIPIRGPFFLAGIGGYQTGNQIAGGDNKIRFFDAEFFALEGQYRHSLGPFNGIGGVGVGYVSGNSAAITTSDGNTAGSTSGASFLVEGVLGLGYQFGRLGVVLEARYGYSPVDFKNVGETLPMGGPTLGGGFDVGF